MKRLIAVLSVLAVFGLGSSVVLAGTADTHQKKECPCPSGTVVHGPGLDGLDLVK
ncbi:hypothetical protein [Deferrisoma camini]|uniref:hypothetical protein n=1 Tax=Deferrisoma camini TaxID=1035120 RepID=UPI0004AD2FD2|nr:hypothetical protein [Deferrisoma camini]